MGLSDLGQSAKNDAKGLVGNIAKAVLVFPNTGIKAVDMRNMETVNAYVASKGMSKLEVSEWACNNRERGIFYTSKTTVETSKLAGLLQDSEGRDLKSLEAALEKGKIQYKKFTVQFNPSSIQITARGGGRYPVSNYGSVGSNQAGKIEYRALDPYITVGFTLIFDATNLADAFMEERLTLGATTVAKNVATAAVGNEYTVRPQVEGFLAALRNEEHRTMIFQWGTLRYTGVLNTVSSSYTMFNTVGNPIRAEVQLGMLMGSVPKDSVDGISYLDYWKKRYGEILDKNGSRDAEGNLTSMDTRNVKNQYSNLINL